MDRLAAMRSEREACLRFCRQLTPEQWQAPSAAEGWRIQDVVPHMGGIAHEFFTPYMAKVIRARSIERYNDQTVERRAARGPDEILAEYEAGPGGGTWQIEPLDGGRLHARAGDTTGVATHITGGSEDVPRWATGREPWQKPSLDITGDHGYATRFLDTLRVI